MIEPRLLFLMVLCLFPGIVLAGHTTATHRPAIQIAKDDSGLPVGLNNGSSSWRKPTPGMVCGWSEEEVFVIPGTASDEEEKAIDKLLDELENALGGGIPQIGAVKKAIEELGPGKDVVDVVVVYKCIDNAGKIHRKRAKLDGQTEAVFWAAKMNLVSGSAKADRDRERQKAINNYRPKVSCCPAVKPAVPPLQPKPNPPTETSPGPGPEPPANSPCKVPPPCDACKAIHERLKTACESLKEIDDEIANLNTQLRPRADLQSIAERDLRRLRESKADDVQIRAKQAELEKATKAADGFRTDINKAQEKRRAKEAEIKAVREELKTCEREKCGKTATGNNPVSGLDPCLVGDWVSQDSTDRQGAVGKGNIKMTIERDSRITIVYDGMNPAVLKNPVTGNVEQVKTWGGTARGRITGKNGVIVLQSVDPGSKVTGTFTQYGKTQTTASSMLGIVILPSPQYLIKYLCEGNTLKISVNFFGEIVDGFIFVKK